MRRHIGFQAVVMTGLLGAVLAVAPVRAQAPGPWVCMTRDFSKRVAYVSPVFSVKVADAMKVNPAWHAIMTSKYGITALPYQSCQGPYPSDAVADSARTKFMDLIRTSMHQPITEVAWTYGGTPPIVVAKVAPAPAAPAAPTAAPALTAADRAAFQAELPQSKGYCEQNLRGLFDCDCFAKMVLHHRLAHPEEMEGLKGGEKRRPPVHDLAIGIRYKLDCTECLSDQHLSTWAHDRVEGEMSQMVLTKMITQAKVDAFAACVAKGFVQQFHADPYLHQYLPAFNAAHAACGNPRA